MIIKEKQLIIPVTKNHKDLLVYLNEYITNELDANEVPVRFVITNTDSKNYYCELGILSNPNNYPISLDDPIFSFRKRETESIDQFNVVLLVPTGIGAEIGGHSGDAGPVARLLASACDNLITHPNVVNASDINELPENGLYVEGSVISRLLMGTVALQKVRSNKLMFIMDKHEDKFFNESAINSVSAARASYGLDCPLVIIQDENIIMRSLYSDSGRAVGIIENFEKLVEICTSHKDKYDAIGLSSIIKVPESFHYDYYKYDDILNPWGGVEAMLTHTLSLLFNVPTAHSPMYESRKLLDMEVGVVDPRKSAETVSVTFLNSILKGLQKSPKIITNEELFNLSNVIDVTNISCLVIPDGCVGLPTLAALEQGIPVIAVRENANRMRNRLEELPFTNGKLFVVDNYLEAVGVMQLLRSGITMESVRRPIEFTNVVDDEEIMFNKENTKEVIND